MKIATQRPACLKANGRESDPGPIKPLIKLTSVAHNLQRNEIIEWSHLSLTRAHFSSFGGYPCPDRFLSHWMKTPTFYALPAYPQDDELELSLVKVCS